MRTVSGTGRSSRLIRISGEDYELLTDLAQTEKRSRAAQLSILIEEALGRRRPPKVAPAPPAKRQSSWVSESTLR